MSMSNEEQHQDQDALEVEGAGETESSQADGATPDAATESDGATEPTDAEAPSPEEHIAALEAELAESRASVTLQTEQLQRLAAEFQNSKRRQEKQLADAIDRAGSHIIQQLLPIIDDFALAFNNLPEELTDEEKAWVDGFRQIQKKLLSVLTEQGLTAIPTEGEFDPTLHEAITSEPHDDIESGHIIQTLRTGYEYKGRVLRPAMVRVAS